MNKFLLLFALTFAFFACEKMENDDNQRLQLNIESCVLDDEQSFVEVKKLKGAGILSVSSSDASIAEVCISEKNDEVFYIIGHGKGNAIITVVDIDNTNVADCAVKTIDVHVSESIVYGDYSYQKVFIKKGESGIFELPFEFESTDSLVGANDYIVSVRAGVELGNKLKVEAHSFGKTKFQIIKGKVELFSLYINVVDEYDLFIQERDRQLTLDYPFISGVNGVSIWRGSGQYSAKIVDESVAVVQSITKGDDWTNQMNNSAAVRVTPLKKGTTNMIITDMVSRQTSLVKLVIK